MDKVYQPGAVTVSGEELRTQEPVGSEEECFCRFDSWEKEYGSALCGVFYDCGNTRVFFKRGWVAHGKVKKSRLYADTVDIPAMTAEILRHGFVHIDEQIPPADVRRIAAKINRFLFVEKLGFRVLVRECADSRTGLDIATGEYRNSAVILPEMITELREKGKISVEGQSESAVGRCIQKLNRCLEFLDADWRSEATFSSVDGKRVPLYIVKVPKDKIRKHACIRRDIEVMAEELLSGGTVLVEGCSRATVFRRVKEINEYLSENNFGLRVKPIYCKKDGSYIPCEIAPSYKKVKCMPNAAAVSAAAEKILSGESISVEGYSRTTAFRRAKEINEYLAANGYSWKVGVSSRKTDGVYFPSEIIKACKENERRGRKKQPEDKKLLETAAAADRLLSGESLSVEGCSRATAARRAKEINEYLAAKGYSWKVKVSSRKTDGVYFPSEIIRACKENERRGRKKKTEDKKLLETAAAAD